jgi:hypothetical protein
MVRLTIAALVCAAGFAVWSAGRPDEIPFAKHTLDLGANETCAVVDINNDGHPDIVSGENWYEGPKWRKHKFRALHFVNNYVDAFSDLPLDVNGDGFADLITASWFSRRLYWSQNPGKGGGGWKEHEIESGANTEFAFLVDIDNDGKANELLPQFGGKAGGLAWYEVKNKSFVKRTVSPQNWGHGIGAGDVNGDARTDILTPKGWFEGPADPRGSDWKWHPEFDLGSTGFIYVHDVNGDGRGDLVTSMAHDYGILWFERGKDGAWSKRVIDDSWSQAHAVALVDLNKDGRPELITGKRYMAHNGRDPGEREPLGIYWYEFLPGKPVQWVKHVVDYGSRAGGGMQIPVADLDGDGDLDFATAGKSGLFLFENLSIRK